MEEAKSQAGKKVLRFMSVIFIIIGIGGSIFSIMSPVLLPFFIAVFIIGILGVQGSKKENVNYSVQIAARVICIIVLILVVGLFIVLLVLESIENGRNIYTVEIPRAPFIFLIIILTTYLISSIYSLKHLT